MKNKRLRLYSLVPAVYRWRDEQRGEPLCALTEVLDSQLDALDANMDALWDNWFIETCAPWVVPYIGELVDVGGIDTDAANVATQRARVADTVSYRSRKGIAPVLGNAASAAGGWPTVAVEMLHTTAAAQNLGAVDLRHGGTADLADNKALALLPTPWNTIAHTVDVRDVAQPPVHRRPSLLAFKERGTGQDFPLATVRASRSVPTATARPPAASPPGPSPAPGTAARGPRSSSDPVIHGALPTARGFGPGNLVLRAYTLRSMAIRSVNPHPVGNPRSGIPEGVPCTLYKPPFVLQGYTFDPSGCSSPLFTVPDTPSRLDVHLRPSQVPQPISRRLLAHDLEERERHGSASSEFFALPPQISITVIWLKESERDDQTKRRRTVLDPSSFIAADLSAWQPPVAWMTKLFLAGQADREMPWGAAIDPELGRFILAGPAVPKEILVDYGRGQGDAVGAGSQTPTSSAAARDTAAPVDDRLFRVARSYSTAVHEAFAAEKELPEEDRRLFAKPGQAVAAWRRTHASGTVEFIDSATYKLDGELLIDLARHRRRDDRTEDSEDVAGARGDGLVPADDDVHGPSLVLTAVPGQRPHFEGDLRLQGGAAAVAVTLRGLSIAGTVRVVGNVDLRVEHCTIQGRPQNRGARSLVYTPQEPEITQTPDGHFAPSSTVFPVVPLPLPRLSVGNSLINAVWWASRSPLLTITDSVVHGGVGPAISGPRDLGPRLRIERSTVFGEVSIRSLGKSLDTLFADPVSIVDPDDRQVSHTWAAPGSRPDLTVLPGVSRQEAAGLAVIFQAKNVCDPGYAKLSLASSPQIREGGSGSSELGVFHRLHGPQRWRNVETVFRDFVPMGMRAAIFMATG